MTKTCKDCRVGKPLDEFHNHSQTKDRRGTYCKPCVRIRSRDWEFKNPEKAKAANKRWDDNNRERRREIVRLSKRRNKATSDAWKKANLERKRATDRASYLRNIEKVRARQRIMAKRHRAERYTQVPAWANAKAIAALYRQAEHQTKETSVAHEVDHIVQLRSKIVCGLHWEGNMQVIPAEINRQKSNKYWPDMP